MSDVLAVIPARGGSKRLPGKNLKKLDGKPLVAHAIDHCGKAAEIDRTVVSTDDREIKSVATEYGCEVPFDRPAELATDTATAPTVVRHVLEQFEQKSTTFEIVCMVLPTTPLRSPSDLDAGVQKLRETTVQSVVGVTEFDHPPFYAVDTDEEGNLFPYFDDKALWDVTRSQEFPAVQVPNGAVFVATVDALFEHENFFTDRTKPYYMPPERSLDIDEPFDLQVARALLQYEANK
jgi:N-acylneuraminate cytidylyltransferase